MRSSVSNYLVVGVGCHKTTVPILPSLSPPILTPLLFICLLWLRRPALLECRTTCLLRQSACSIIVHPPCLLELLGVPSSLMVLCSSSARWAWQPGSLGVYESRPYYYFPMNLAFVGRERPLHISSRVPQTVVTRSLQVLFLDAALHHAAVVVVDLAHAASAAPTER
jgi:hypothetical protein